MIVLDIRHAVGCRPRSGDLIEIIIGEALLEDHRGQLGELLCACAQLSATCIHIDGGRHTKSRVFDRGDCIGGIVAVHGMRQ